ncbi:MAG: hypothetical protein A2X12_02330 [Bacteroidetes bacterium GWE2_29_8]|nr:MAG: hypothetical protein A2X12_02330 [Bacteroidetes bacterium GWE2_29_8]OFY14603.1 MAG: hypothetical protein A2X02_05915 [Bacteroidetes bacterium GWF2_29_10]
MIIITTICLFVILFYAAVIGYYVYAWEKEPDFKCLDEAECGNFVSIIIPVKNEPENIIVCLNSIASQDYNHSKYEVIIVDDNSDDNSYINEIRNINNNLQIKYIQLADLNLKGKKSAINVAVNQSKGNLIITTDSDCTYSSKWLSTLVCFYNRYKPKFIAAPVIAKGNSSFLSYFQSIEMSGLMLITGASFFSKRPIMCSGANIMYDKQVFIELNPYCDNISIPSGDDYFLMQSVLNAYPNDLMFVKSPEVIVITNSVSSGNSFIKQRMRWVSKNYNNIYSLSFLIGLIVFLTNFQILTLSFASASFNHSIISLFLFTFIVKIFIDYKLLKTSSKYFNIQCHSFLKLSLFNIFYVVMTAIVSIFVKVKWR